MWSRLSLMLVVSALLGCVGHRPLGDNQACPCAPGWTCDTSRNTCVAQDGGSGGGGFSGGGGGGFSGGGGGGFSGAAGSVPDGGTCGVPDGQIVPYTTVADLERLIVGDWWRCDVISTIVGLRISADHTWNALKRGVVDELQPITTGFEGYGTWTAVEVGQDRIQFNLHQVNGSGSGGFVIFTDTQKMRIAFGYAPGDYRRQGGGGGSGGSGGGRGGASGSGSGGASGSGGGGTSGSGGGGSGGTVSIPGPGDCSAPDGRVVPYTTLADLERLIFGDWLRCRGNAYPSEFGEGLRISPDHTWSALKRDGGGVLQPITTGFDGYGTWTDNENGPGQFQFNLLKIGGGGAGFVVLFTDTGQMRMDFFTSAADYVRLGAAP